MSDGSLACPCLEREGFAGELTDDVDAQYTQQHFDTDMATLDTSRVIEFKNYVEAAKPATIPHKDNIFSHQVNTTAMMDLLTRASRIGIFESHRQQPIVICPLLRSSVGESIIHWGAALRRSVLNKQLDSSLIPMCGHVLRLCFAN